MLKSKVTFTSNITLSQSFNFIIYIGLLVFVLSLPFGYSTVFLNIGMTFVMIGWVGRMISERQLGWLRTSLDVPIVLFLGLALVASFFAPHRASSSLGFFWKLLRAILLFYAVIHSQLGQRWKHVVIGTIIAAGIASTLGLWYYLNDTRLGIDFMGKVSLEYQDELSSIGNGFSDELRTELRQINIPLSQSAKLATAKHPDEWRINDLERDRRYVIRKDKTHLTVYMIEQRLTGTFKMPNDLGAYLALSLPFVIGYFMANWGAQRKHKFGTWTIVIVGIVVVLMFVNLALTLTRAAWISVAIATTAIFIYFVFHKLKKLNTVRQRINRSLILFSAIFAIFIVSLFLMPQHIKNRLQTILQQPTGFMGERPQYWQTSIELIKKYPLTGIGLGRFRYEYQLNGPEEQYNIPYHAHNIYLHIAVEHGIPSLFLFLWMIIIFWKQIWRIRSTVDLENHYWSMGTFLGGCGFLISALIYGLVDNILHQRTILLFWFMVGILFYYYSHKDEKHEEKLGTD